MYITLNSERLQEYKMFVHLYIKNMNVGSKNTNHQF